MGVTVLLNSKIPRNLGYWTPRDQLGDQYLYYSR